MTSNYLARVKGGSGNEIALIENRKGDIRGGYFSIYGHYNSEVDSLLNLHVIDKVAVASCISTSGLRTHEDEVDNVEVYVHGRKRYNTDFDYINTFDGIRVRMKAKGIGIHTALCGPLVRYQPIPGGRVVTQGLLVYPYEYLNHLRDAVKEVTHEVHH